MTKQELLMRQSYDGVNESLLLRRRSTLAVSLEEIDEEASSSDSKSPQKFEEEIDEEPAKNEEQSPHTNCRIT